MPSTRTMSHSRTYPVAFDEAYAATLAVPLERLFDRRFAAIPAIRSVEQEGEGPWEHAGQVRAIHTADGGEMREELTSVDPPREFAYHLTPVGGPMKPLVAHVDGAWRFEPVGTGTRITWEWTVHAASGAAGLALPAFARMWQGYARRALDRLEELLPGWGVNDP